MGELLLGKEVDYDAPYNPGLLCAIPRALGRAELVIDAAAVPFFGCDIWNAYELSWLDAAGKPIVAIAELRIPVDSACLVESKSLKLYLNSLNQHRFTSAAAVCAALESDLGACVGSAVAVELYLPDRWAQFEARVPPGTCLDDLPLAIDRYTPAPELLTAAPDVIVSRCWFSRLLRSRCPVTGQPDWGTVVVEYEGPEIDAAALLSYIVSFRQHQEFHEHCVERMFIDISRHCRPHLLTVYARYLRRGGLDINPYRSSAAAAPQNIRFFQQ